MITTDAPPSDGRSNNLFSWDLTGVGLSTDGGAGVPEPGALAVVALTRRVG